MVPSSVLVYPKGGERREGGEGEEGGGREGEGRERREKREEKEGEERSKGGRRGKGERRRKKREVKGGRRRDRKSAKCLFMCSIVHNTQLPLMQACTWVLEEIRMVQLERVRQSL